MSDMCPSDMFPSDMFPSDMCPSDMCPSNACTPSHESGVGCAPSTPTSPQEGAHSPSSSSQKESSLRNHSLQHLAILHHAPVPTPSSSQKESSLRNSSRSMGIGTSHPRSDPMRVLTSKILNSPFGRTL
eukprot:CAMPEP_0181193866 /NCGR_PEP_ID=MMETSP1096-20121128/14041_1 /TAXON_ID=156174 ORGANISM="Chrysochromulina ericina, Strain CCMP281" /NCGR_SAMPLE_ID=MMETSP1096 /ASSEMBLY_ACC=CAM_ASM_000453 /LENGTH=128 /DNA_ID=CAMNT_0023283349 /DNA_START=801 /DNA_END=1187 /DNA_ORIENTATION=-